MTITIGNRSPQWCVGPATPPQAVIVFPSCTLYAAAMWGGVSHRATMHPSRFDQRA
jgi:hypothetical protein